MKIGWIGTGVMGQSMAGHLQAAGHELYVFNRTKSKADLLVEKGAVWFDTPAKVAQNAEVVFTIVGFPQDVEGVYLGEQGVFAEKGACRIVVDMTTSEPGLARKIARAAAEKGISSLDAPVSGGDVGAKTARSRLWLAGRKRPLMKCCRFSSVWAKISPIWAQPGPDNIPKCVTRF